MKALTLWQPWASAVAHCGKPVENRTWRPPEWLVGQRLAIHAGKRVDRDAIEDILDEGFELPNPLPSGAVVAVARVAGWVERTCVTSFSGIDSLRAGRIVESIWFSGPVGWVLEDVVPVAPIECRGRQGIWTLPSPVYRAVATQFEARL